MSLNNNVQDKTYIPLTPFKGWVLENFPFIETDFDALTNYQLLCKVTEYLNNVISNQNQVQELGTELVTAYNDLLEYVNNYFDNLDVQEEINNKLDDLVEDGTLTTLIGNYCNPLINAQNTEIANIRNIVTNVASGSPLVASSVDEMTNTSRVYVNTTDGKWYYYDGDSWEIGGTYQSSGISNNSIDLLMLDSDLQSNFFSEYSSPINLGNAYTGYYKQNGTLVENDTYKNYHYSLVNGETYFFVGRNISQCTALIIKDSSNNVVYGSNPSTSTNWVNYKFKCKENNLTAYISMEATERPTYYSQYTNGTLRYLKEVYNQLKYTSEVPLYMTLDDYYIAASSAGNNQIRFVANNSGTIKFYQAEKGRKYLITGSDYSNICGLLIAGLDDTIIYASSTASIGNETQDINYTFSPTTDCLILVSDYENVISSNVSVIESSIDTEINPLIGKKLGMDGDSIMTGSAQDGSNGYGNIIAVNNAMNISKKSKGGATITYGTYSDETPRHWICTSVLTIDSDCDYVIVNGGVNDYWNDVPLGTYTDSYTADVDNTNFYGALETLARNLLSRFSTKKIAFVTNHHINDILTTIRQSSGLCFGDYLEAIYKVMNKYGIKIIDVGLNTHFNTAISGFKQYTVNNDGIHPTQNGYNYFYVDYVTNELKKM